MPSVPGKNWEWIMFIDAYLVIKIIIIMNHRMSCGLEGF